MRFGPICLATLPLAVAGCGGEAATEPAGSNAVAAEQPAAIERPVEPPRDEPEAIFAWTLPAAFRVVVPKAPGEASGGLPRLIRHHASGIELTLVQPGSFEFGSTDADPGHADDEAPARRVDVAAFFLARTETTGAQWRAAGGERGRAAGDDHPIVEVSWDQARAWCEAAGLALPTEIQWEYAASGPDDHVFPWGDDANDHAVNARGTNAGDLWDETAPVASLPEGCSWCGAFDMAGNVSEWCRDAWTADHASEPDDAKRVIRGGSFTCRPPWCLRTAYRDGVERELQSPNLGFRVVLDVE
jgi:formylglycine-generating enzyme required for sulfatase activity